MNGTYSRKDIDLFWSQVTKGTHLTCLENTYHGRTPSGIVENPGKTTMGIRMEDGQLAWLNPPKTVDSVIFLDLNTGQITYTFTGANGTPAQTTWRIDR